LIVIIAGKIIKKLLRSVSKTPFIWSGLRVYLLRKAGLIIGNDVVINDGFTLACTIGFEPNLTIGDRVAFGPDVIVVVTSHPNNSLLRALKTQYPSIEIKGKTTICHDAWVGAGAIIMPNVTVGECSIVGAGAVVTRDVLPYTVVAGTPARVIKTFSDEDKDVIDKVKHEC
jgi:acetyltransferase-like isoleucine patch superfamily enzyme